MPKNYQAAITAVAQVRHDFAHGRRTDLDPDRRAGCLVADYADARS
jgi:hypothetical protein